mgnify:FL=1
MEILFPFSLSLTGVLSTHGTDYTYMLRLYKNIQLSYASLHTSADPIPFTTSFSSYPGALSSIDDYYLTSRGLIVLETTNLVFNDSLWESVDVAGLLVFVRSTLANRLARDGQEWVDLFSQHNSGTYNNQWMIVDTNKFTPGKRQVSAPGLFWVVEQTPLLFQRYACV